MWGGGRGERVCVRREKYKIHTSANKITVWRAHMYAHVGLHERACAFVCVFVCARVRVCVCVCVCERVSTGGGAWEIDEDEVVRQSCHLGLC